MVVPSRSPIPTTAGYTFHIVHQSVGGHDDNSQYNASDIDGSSNVLGVIQSPSLSLYAYGRLTIGRWLEGELYTHTGQHIAHLVPLTHRHRESTHESLL